MTNLNCLIFLSVFLRLGSSTLLSLENRENLDQEGKVLLAWSYDEPSQVITFELEVASIGFVGFGISPTGGMGNSDMFIGGVFPNGSAYYGDYSTIGSNIPRLDVQQDWTLLSAVELSTVGKTFLKFSRLLNTCDEDDLIITTGTVRLIWSFGETDDIEYHKTNRGTHSTNLVGTPMPELDTEGLQRWEMTLDMEMPKLDTSYWCSFHKGPILTEKHHIIAFDAFLDGLDAVQHTHHFILYECHLPTSHNETLDKVFGNMTVDTGFLGGHCYDPTEGAVELPVQFCQKQLFVWAKGGKMMTFPDNVGYPIGEGDTVGKQTYHMLEIHYDNPTEREGVSFNTGVEFFYTNEIREEDAGLMAVGHGTNIMITVPPNTSDFVIVGHCSSECTDWGIEEEEGVTVFNVLLHAHMSGRKLKLRQFRGTTEVPWVDYDDFYDFDYQQNKPIPLTKLMKGDHLTYECTYDSTWNNGNVVIGGISSRNEMCQTFIWYYPKQKLDDCLSLFPLELHMQDLGITNYTTIDTLGEVHWYINEPESLRGPYEESMSKKFIWTPEFIEKYQHDRRFGYHDGYCQSRATEDFLIFNTTYPENVDIYVPLNPCEAVTGSTEIPTASTKQSTASTEQSTASTEQSTASTEQSTASTEQSTATENSTASTEHPPASTEQPTASTEHPPASTEQPTASTEHPPASTEQPTASTEHPPASTEQSTASTEQSTATENSTASTEHPTASTKTSSSTDSSTQSTQNTTTSTLSSTASTASSNASTTPTEMSTPSTEIQTLSTESSPSSFEPTNVTTESPTTQTPDPTTDSASALGLFNNIKMLLAVIIIAHFY